MAGAVGYQSGEFDRRGTGLWTGFLSEDTLADRWRMESALRPDNTYVIKKSGARFGGEASSFHRLPAQEGIPL